MLMLKMQMAQVHWSMSGRDKSMSRTRHFVAGKFNSTNQEQKANQQINSLSHIFLTAFIQILLTFFFTSISGTEVFVHH